MIKRLFYLGRPYEIASRESNEGISYQLDGEALDAIVRTGQDGPVWILLGDSAFQALVSTSFDHTDVCVDGYHFRFEHQQHSSSTSTASDAHDGKIVSPMTGKIIQILARQGDEVEKGQPLMLVEAMKMEFPVKAPLEGTILRVHVGEGELVEMGTCVIEVEAHGNERDSE